MGFFTQHGSFSDGNGEFSVAEDGVYSCRLTAVEPIMQPSFDDPLVQEAKFKWVFETADDVDDAGKPYRFVKFTSRKYGNDKAAITLLLDGMLSKRLTAEEFAGLDLDDLMARKWKVLVELTVNSKGNQINKISSVKPEKAAGNRMGTAAATSPGGRVPVAAGAAAANNPNDDPDPFE